jgi:hypothetical protein
MNRTFACLITFLFVCCPHIAEAIDESDSLALLVATLDAADDPGIRTALMRAC